MSRLCEHGRRRRQTDESGSASICEHGRQRYLCKDSGGKSICCCCHETRRSACMEYGGGSGAASTVGAAASAKGMRVAAAFASTGGARNDCKECGGSSICEHVRHRKKTLNL